MESKVAGSPSLRFPEFRDDWQRRNLSELTENGFSNGVFNDPAKVGKGYRLINVKDMYLDGPVAENSLTLVALDPNEFERNRVESGDIFFTRSSLVKEGIAYSNIYLGKGEDVTFDGHLIRLRPNKQEVISIFANYLLKTASVRKQLISYGQTATMTTIGQKEIGEVNVSLPSYEEQQKIADFLTAVDEKIAAIKKKKELLERYKKGAMQAIFSQRIRFRDASGNLYPDWASAKFSEYLYSLPVRESQIQSTEFMAEGRYPVVDQGQSLIAGYSDKDEKVIKNLPVIVFGDHTTFIKFVDFNFIVGADGTKVLKNLQGNIKYLYYYLEYSKPNPEGYKRHFNILRDLDLEIPHADEQQKIADFMSALDQRIELEAKKLEQAQQFKKALLQQMFT